MSELLPCPFCGGEAKINTMKWMDGYTATALCKNEPNFHHLDIWDEDEAKAVERITEAWNTRAERSYHIVQRKPDGQTSDSKTARYCPNCGARVIGGNE